MISKETSAAIKDATTIKKQDSAEQPMPNHNTVYAPLLKYGAIAFGIVSVIVTSAILIENKLNIRSHEVALENADVEQMAAIQTEEAVLINANIQTDSTSVNQGSVEANSKTTIAESKPKEAVIANVAIAREANKKPVNTPIIVTAVEKASLPLITQTETLIINQVTPKHIKPHVQIVSQHQNFMLKQDKIQLQRLKLNHDRVLGSIRNHAGKTTDQFEKNIRQLESSYTRQVAAVKRSQDIRKSFATNRM